MSSRVIQSLFQRRNVRRRTGRTRTNRCFRFGHEMLEDRITPTTVTGLNPTFGPASGTDPGDDHGDRLHRCHGSRLRHGLGRDLPFANSTTITTVSPPGTGIVDVTVTATGGTSPLNPPNDQFTYGPTVTGLSRQYRSGKRRHAGDMSSGPASPAPRRSILARPGRRTYGPQRQRDHCCQSARQRSRRRDRDHPGWHVASHTRRSIHLSDFAPTVTNISPNSGPAAGGTLVTITGTNFTGPTAVDFGTIAATNVTVVSD